MSHFKADSKSELPVLLHPPLLEVIFELRWELDGDLSSGKAHDPSYPMLYGRLYERLKKDFPLLEDLPSTQAHPDATPFTPRHRMRKEKNGYPLLQVGPGILTLNMAKSYSWQSFSSLANRLVEAVAELFPSSQFPLNFIKTELRFVNGVRFDLARENPLVFLAEKLHTKIELDADLWTHTSLHERPSSLGFNVSYALEKPIGNLGIAFNLGQFDGKPAFIQQTIIHSFGELAPADPASFVLWLEEAHEAAENCFAVLFKGALMERFYGG